MTGWPVPAGGRLRGAVPATAMAGTGSRAIEAVLVLQCLLVPADLSSVADPRISPGRDELVCAVPARGDLVAAAHFLRASAVARRREFWVMADAPLAIMLVMAAVEVLVQHDIIGLTAAAPDQLRDAAAVPGLGAAPGAAVRRAPCRQPRRRRTHLEQRVRELTTEIERNFSQLAELRVEQVTEKERKRIAADLHDDLGAKLLTIVHTSESERISTLAREALEEMRLSVRGLTGKPMRLADALADWRAETVLAPGPVEHRGRLAQARPRRPSTCCRRAASCRRRASCARRSATSSSTAARTRCSVRCAIADGDFALTIQDNGTRHSDGARRQARPRPRHVEHEAPRQADAGPVPGRVRPRLRHRDTRSRSALNRRAPSAHSDWNRLLR